MKTVMIASTGSGRGKTALTSALLLSCRNKGIDVHGFKCGPDYIDPMYHRQVLGVPSANLDSFFCDDMLLREVFEDNSGDVNIIESAMGLYDGKGASSKNSAYEIAKILNSGIILVVDGYGMGYSIVAEIKGFLSMDTDNLIKGIILNRTGEKFYSKIAPVITDETGIKVLGYVPKLNIIDLKSRHLGLLSPKENNFIEKIELFCQEVEKTVDVNAIISSDLFDNKGLDNRTFDIKDIKTLDNKLPGNIDASELCEIKIAIAKDEAFSFMYEENIKLLEKMGAEIVYFSPIHDKILPDNISGIILYGGYPENYLEELSNNTSMISDLRRAILDNIPVLAECGGYMYLLDGIEKNGNAVNMVGAIRGIAYREKSLVRFGYVNVQLNDSEVIKAHEFHHYDVKDSEKYSEDIALENSSGERYFGIVEKANIFAGFPHLYYLSNPSFIKNFLDKSIKYRNEK